MNIWKLSWRSLVHKPWSMALTLILFALGIGLVSFLFVVEEQIQEKFEKNLAGVDLVIGAKGSPLQMILSSMYHVDAPTGNIAIDDIRPFLNPKHPLIDQSLPLSMGDSYRGYRIVGTTTDILDWYDAKVEAGRPWKYNFEVVIGHTVAEKLNIGLGKRFKSSHGLTDDEDLDHEHDQSFKVVGILAPTGSVIDQLVLTTSQSFWLVHDHDHDHSDEGASENEDEHDHEDHSHDGHSDHDHDGDGHPDHEAHEHDHDHDHHDHNHDDHSDHDHDGDGHPDHEAHEHDHNHDHHDHSHDDHSDHDHDDDGHPDHEAHEHDRNHDHHDHSHDDHSDHDHDGDGHPDHEAHEHDHSHDENREVPLSLLEEEDGSKEITSLLLRFKGHNFQALNMQRSINENTDMQAATPAIEINRLFSMMDSGEQMLRLLALVIILVSGLSIFISLYSSLSDRKYELALLRSMGAGRGTVFGHIIVEGLILSVIGCALGLLISHFGLSRIGSMMESSYRYQFDAFRFVSREWWLIIFALVVGFLAALIPAIKASKTDIADTLVGG